MKFFVLLALSAMVPSANTFVLPEDTEYTDAMVRINAATAEIDTAKAKVFAAADKVREMVPSRGTTAVADLYALVEETERALDKATEAVRNAANSSIRRKHALVLHAEAHRHHMETKESVRRAVDRLNTERSTERYVAELYFKKLLRSWAVTAKTNLVAINGIVLHNAKQNLVETLKVEKTLTMECARGRDTLEVARKTRSNMGKIAEQTTDLHILDRQLNDAIHNTIRAEKERDVAEKSQTDASQTLEATKHFLMEAETALSEKQHQLEKDRSNAQHAFEEAYIIAYPGSFATVYGKLG